MFWLPVRMLSVAPVAAIQFRLTMASRPLGSRLATCIEVQLLVDLMCVLAGADRSPWWTVRAAGSNAGSFALPGLAPCAPVRLADVMVATSAPIATVTAADACRKPATVPAQRGRRFGPTAPVAMNRTGDVMHLVQVAP